MINKTIALNRSFYDGTAVLNVFLLAGAILLLIYYVIISNMITASHYRVSLLNNELADLTETNGLLTAQKLSMEDSLAVVDFAQSHNMVEARFVSHIFENSDVALKN